MFFAFLKLVIFVFEMMLLELLLVLTANSLKMEFLSLFLMILLLQSHMLLRRRIERTDKANKDHHQTLVFHEYYIALDGIRCHYIRNYSTSKLFHQCHLFCYQKHNTLWMIIQNVESCYPKFPSIDCETRFGSKRCDKIQRFKGPKVNVPLSWTAS